MDPPPLPSLPDDWSDPAARAQFYALLPKPLVVLIACDLAALTRHGALGLKALHAVRLWLVGQAEGSDLRAAWEEIWRVMMAPGYRQTASHRAAFDAAQAAATADAAYWASDLSSPPRRAKGSSGRGAAAHYRRHRRVVEQILRCAADPAVRRLLAAAERDPRARPLFWDAMLEAGYVPLEPCRTLPWREGLVKHWRRFWGKGEAR